MTELACKIPEALSADRKSQTIPNQSSRPIWADTRITPETIRSEYLGPTETLLKDVSNVEIVVSGKPKFDELNKIRKAFRKRHPDGEEIEKFYSMMLAPSKNQVDMTTLAGANRVNYFMQHHDLENGTNRPLQDYSVIHLANGATRTDLMLGLMSEKVMRSIFPSVTCEFEGKSTSAINFTNFEIRDAHDNLSKVLNLKGGPAALNGAWTRYCKANATELKLAAGLAIEPVLTLLGNKELFSLSVVEVNLLTMRVNKFLSKLERQVTELIGLLQKAYCPEQVIKESFFGITELINDTRVWLNRDAKKE